MFHFDMTGAASQTGKEKIHGNHTDCDPDPNVGWRYSHLAPQQKMGILSQRRTRIGPSDPDHPAAPGADLKRF